MKFDRDRLLAILEASHSYYGSGDEKFRNDARLNPGAVEFIASQFDPTMRVLDVGCGDGATLLENSHRFASGLGVDSDPEHFRLAEDAKAQKRTQNVEFRLLDFVEDSKQLEAGTFDFVFSERGPIGYNGYGIQAARRLLRPGGLLFCEVIGDLHHQEVREVFGSGTRNLMTVADQVKVAMERNGVSVRLVSDLVSKRYYPDVYEWLKFQCSIWAWSGVPFPSPDDPRLELFVERNMVPPSGEIETTHHVVWVGGVKLAAKSGYQEFQHFDE